jgi:hypothetical protein
MIRLVGRDPGRGGVHTTAASSPIPRRVTNEYKEERPWKEKRETRIVRIRGE